MRVDDTWSLYSSLHIIYHPNHYTGANLTALWVLPPAWACKTVEASTASSAGAFGVFLTGTALPRIFKKPLEVICLAPFVLSLTVQR